MKHHNLIFLLLLVLNGDLYATEKPQSLEDRGRSLPLECVAIADSHDMLCSIQTESPYGPFDDVVFYYLDKTTGAVILLGSHSDAVSTFVGFGFSSGGQYMWLGWAEEGHPFFEFYRTSNFIKLGTKAPIRYVLNDYYFNQFEVFTDTGSVTYSQIEDYSEHRIIDADKLNGNTIAPTNNKSYLNTIKININEKH